jgi:hypothetical protein
MADPTQVVQYQTGLPPEIAPYGQRLLGAAESQVFKYKQDPTTGEYLKDDKGMPIVEGFQPYQQYTGDRVAQFTPLQQQAFNAAQTLGPNAATEAAARGLQSLAQSAAGTSYDSFTGSAPSMSAPGSVTTGGINPASVNYAGYDAFTGTAPQMRGPSDVSADQITAAQTNYSPQLTQYQMGPAERVGTGAFTDQGNIQSYMSPYMQNVVDVQAQQAKRQAAIAQQALGAQAARSGAFGGSGAALQRAQANAELQRNLQNIQATGLQSAYQQAMQQYSTDAARQLQAAGMNQQAGMQVGSQNLAAQLATQQLGTQTGLQVALANMNAQQQAAVQNQAAKLQAAGMNQQAALQTATQNMQSQLQTQQLGEQSRQFGAGQGLQAAMQNAGFAQQAAIQSEANRLQAQGMNQQAALETARQNLQSQLQTQQLGEQSRQFGAGLGLQGLQTASTALQNAGQMGQTAFNQQQTAIGLQNQLGGQQQQQTQNILNNQYQDYLNFQNQPYKQLGFMSDIIRGLPMSQTSSTMYQAPPSLMGVATGLTGAYLAGGAPKIFKEGGAVKSYAEGGSVFSRENKERIVGNLHPAGLPRAMQGAMMRGDMDTAQAAQANMAEDDAIRRGIAAAAPSDIGVGYARGGIVAFADRGLVDEEEATSSAGNLWRSITGGIKGGIEKTARAGELRRQMEENRTGFFEALTPTQRAERKSRGEQLRAEYDQLLGKTPSAPAPKVTGDDQYNADVKQGLPQAPAKAVEKPAAKPSPQISKALDTMSAQSGIPKDTLLDSYTALRSKFEAEGAADRKEMAELMKSFMGEGKKVREGATNKALQDFFLNMAAQASQPGVARGRGLGQLLQPAGAAAPAFIKSRDESERLARELDANDQKLALMGKQFEISQRAGDRKTAMEMATSMENIKRQNEQLGLQRQQLQETMRSNMAREGLSARQLEVAANKQGLSMATLKTRAKTMASQDVTRMYKADPMMAMNDKKNGITPEMRIAQREREYQTDILLGLVDTPKLAADSE